MEFDFYAWIIIPLFIFCARIADVTLGTLRFIFISRGYHWLAPTVGFFEVIIWVLAVREVLVNLRNVACVLAYGLGFAAGNFIGLWVEDKLSIGMVLVRIWLKQDQKKLLAFFKKNNYGYTIIEGEGSRVKVKILFTILKRKNLEHVLAAVTQYMPDVFYTIESIKRVKEGIYPYNTQLIFAKLFRKNRKSK
ncbi:MAG: DUF5698 domain-containing protein [Acidobacteria bacterium]|jgi:uncharacterized protein YebE (UPF0316 family)|nr:DUF5698 domain-containing protein [Acidobacteriota bacterium]